MEQPKRKLSEGISWVGYNPKVEEYVKSRIDSLGNRCSFSRSWTSHYTEDFSWDWLTQTGIILYPEIIASGYNSREFDLVSESGGDMRWVGGDWKKVYREISDLAADRNIPLLMFFDSNISETNPEPGLDCTSYNDWWQGRDRMMHDFTWSYKFCYVDQFFSSEGNEEMANFALNESQFQRFTKLMEGVFPEN